MGENIIADELGVSTAGPLVNGIEYQQRCEALDFALRYNIEGDTTAAVVIRANTYLAFLQGGSQSS